MSLILIAGALLLMLLTLIAGGVNHNPTDLIYFLQADTSKIPGAPAISRWTFWNVCSVSANGRNACGEVHPAFPLDPPSGRNFGTTKGVPTQFIGYGHHFLCTCIATVYLTSHQQNKAILLYDPLHVRLRTHRPLFRNLLPLPRSICALQPYWELYLQRTLLRGTILPNNHGSPNDVCFPSLPRFPSLPHQCLLTDNLFLNSAAYVKGRNNFRSNNLTATLGSYSFGFMWAAMACLFLATVMFCVAGVTSKKADATYASKTHGRSFFGRKKSKRDRGSFIDSESQRRVVKDEFS